RMKLVSNHRRAVRRRLRAIAREAATGRQRSRRGGPLSVPRGQDGGGGGGGGAPSPPPPPPPRPPPPPAGPPPPPPAPRPLLASPSSHATPVLGGGCASVDLPPPANSAGGGRGAGVSPGRGVRGPAAVLGGRQPGLPATADAVGDPRHGPSSAEARRALPE